MTAHYCLFSDGSVTGQTVLVAGGAGAVGHFAIELAKRDGARVVATVSNAEKAALAEKAGADLVVNYRSPDVVQQVKAFAPSVDRVIEVALGANLALDLAVVRRRDDGRDLRGRSRRSRAARAGLMTAMSPRFARRSAWAPRKRHRWRLVVATLPAGRPPQKLAGDP